ncbi:hypothetical protein B0H11DRAFT_2250944 [Mycena galericulata]|nr:hypothetical protein B0H11DRAFT_2250944 [Mycena galericulata]
MRSICSALVLVGSGASDTTVAVFANPNFPIAAVQIVLSFDDPILDNEFKPWRALRNHKLIVFDTLVVGRDLTPAERMQAGFWNFRFLQAGLKRLGSLPTPFKSFEILVLDLARSISEEFEFSADQDWELRISCWSRTLQASQALCMSRFEGKQRWRKALSGYG